MAKLGPSYQTLLGHTRLSPPSLSSWAEAGGLYPFLSSVTGDPYSRISHVSFRQRTGGESGAFFDYTARYGAIRDQEDKVTLRDTLKSGEQNDLFHALTEKIGLTHFLDLPLITLSNGQTRRARIVKAILDRPELLLLDEPLAGLDAPSRSALTSILQQLHLEGSPRVIIGLRKGEDVPPWITHILEIEGGTARTKISSASHQPSEKNSQQDLDLPSKDLNGQLLVDLQNVNVSYGNRKVLKDINWQIRQGERWHLQGANGCGKTTLLSLLTGDHPQSFTQRHLLLPAFDKHSRYGLGPRKRTPTAHLRALIGVVSPEMFDAFPRRHPGMSVWEAVTTGFDGGFVPLTRNADAQQRRLGGVGWVDVAGDDPGLSANTSAEETESIRSWRVQRCWEVLEALGPAAWAPGRGETRSFASLSFSSLSPGEQRLVLLMRALVGRPPLVLLDEVWSGMDDMMIAAARRYLRADGGADSRQAVVVITHWEDEVPWTGSEVKKFKLEAPSI
ncbi:hypothetical protein M413DRAFT_13644 [Hebeloma cylindrosporum]|uniref:ABC transporter domain-containing protein n=1 Tax=Hebeloma cylindrosporum TaxID=76867 RepID=A0A0C2Y744_HEBCY|nr:hypothetical protein M413DRAFT_13644 [Hebeloma cylindrosporum h7]